MGQTSVVWKQAVALYHLELSLLARSAFELTAIGNPDGWKIPVIVGVAVLGENAVAAYAAGDRHLQFARSVHPPEKDRGCPNQYRPTAHPR